MRSHSLKIRKTIKAPRPKVYQAWSDPKIAKTWSCPEGCEISLFRSNPRIGGKYRISMKTPGGILSAYGIYREISPNRKLVYTWVWDVPDTEENLVTVDFKAQGKNTQITLCVSGFSVPGEVDSNREGWKSSLGRLAKRFA